MLELLILSTLVFPVVYTAVIPGLNIGLMSKRTIFTFKCSLFSFFCLNSDQCVRATVYYTGIRCTKEGISNN